MSGIVGLYHFATSAAPRGGTARMLAALSHRGPEGRTTWQQGRIGFGHAALHTTPEARHEVWPLVSPDGDRALVADARIDNRAELLSLLRPRRTEAGVVTDAALILAAYERWGRDCARRLVGDFAFALWDRRREWLFCARDVFGVRPFYYALEAGRRFAFGSELKALLRLDDGLSALNEEHLADVLAGLSATTTDTAYASIRRLPPAHTLTVTPGACRVDRYWSLDAARTVRYASDAEYAAAFRAVFDEAVRCRLRSPGPVGALLSGGLDSSSIVATAQALNATPPLHTFSTVFDAHPSCDERRYIEAVVQQGGVTPHAAAGEDVSPVRLLDALGTTQDQPYAAPNLALSWLQYTKARAQGIRVLLDGHGGDEVVSHGDGRLFELARAGRWWGLARELRGLRRTGRLGSATALFGKYAWGLGVLPWLRRHPRVHALWNGIRRGIGLFRRWGPAEPAPDEDDLQVLRAAVRERTGVDDRYAAHRREQRRPLVEAERHARQLRHPIQVGGFEVLDPLSASFGIETRYPFWDRRLVEFCLALPSDQKLRHGWGRFVLREAMAGRLPEAVRLRATKTDFVPFLFGDMVRERKQLQSLLFSPSTGEKEYVNETAMREIWRTFLQSDASTVSSRLLFVTWTVAVFRHWLQGRSATGAEPERSQTEADNGPAPDHRPGGPALPSTHSNPPYP